AGGGGGGGIWEREGGRGWGGPPRGGAPAPQKHPPPRRPGGGGGGGGSPPPARPERGQRSERLSLSVRGIALLCCYDRHRDLIGAARGSGLPEMQTEDRAK